MTMTTKIYLFTTGSCPHCPAAKHSLSLVEQERKDIIVEYLTLPGQYEQQLAARFEVQSVPTFIIQDEEKPPIGLTGAQSKEVIIKYIEKAQGKEIKKEPSAFKKLLSKLGIDVKD